MSSNRELDEKIIKIDRARERSAVWPKNLCGFACRGLTPLVRYFGPEGSKVPTGSRRISGLPNARPASRRISGLSDLNPSCNIGRHVLDARRIDGLRTVRRHENFYCFVVIADGTLIERTLDAPPSLGAAAPSKMPGSWPHGGPSRPVRFHTVRYQPRSPGRSSRARAEPRSVGPSGSFVLVLRRMRQSRRSGRLTCRTSVRGAQR